MSEQDIHLISRGPSEAGLGTGYETDLQEDGVYHLRVHCQGETIVLAVPEGSDFAKLADWVIELSIRGRLVAIFDAADD